MNDEPKDPVPGLKCSDAGFVYGTAEAFAEATTIVLEEACSAFRQGRFKRARELRRIALVISGRASEAQERWAAFVKAKGGNPDGSLRPIEPHERAVPVDDARHERPERERS